MNVTALAVVAVAFGISATLASAAPATPPKPPAPAPPVKVRPLTPVEKLQQDKANAAAYQTKYSNDLKADIPTANATLAARAKLTADQKNGASAQTIAKDTATYNSDYAQSKKDAATTSYDAFKMQQSRIAVQQDYNQSANTTPSGVVVRSSPTRGTRN